jgi:Zn-dependent oligopeptidase
MANDITAVVQNDALRDELWKNSWREYENMSWNKASDRIKQLYESRLAGAPV